MECCRGTKPSQAAKCRALANRLMSPTVAAIKDAVIGPMLVGMKQQVQISAMSASASDLVTLAVLGAGRIVL